MNGKQVRKLLEEHGWRLDRVTGSHHIFFNKEFTHPIYLPIHGSKDLSIGLVRDILKQSGLLHFWKNNKGGKK